MTTTFIQNSNSWNFLPSAVKEILKENGYNKTDFTASTVRITDPDLPADIFYSVLRAKSGGFLSIWHLEKILQSGVIPSVHHGSFALNINHEVYHQVVEEY